MPPIPPPPLDDDALSADLDDQAGDDVHARITADAEARSRQDTLRAAGDAIREPVPPLPEETVDGLISRAMSAAPSDASTPDHDQVAPPVPLAPRRQRRRPGGRRWLVAAVVVALAVLGLGLIRSGLNESNRNQTASRSAPTEAGSDGATTNALKAAPSTTAPTAHGAIGSAETPPTVDRFTSITELGSYPTADDLRSALRTSFPAGKPTTADEATLTATNRCAVVVENQMKTDPAQAAATATLAGRPVVVFVLPATPPASSKKVDLVVAVDREACTPDLSFYRDA